jgi:hypothetical protein
LNSAPALVARRFCTPIAGELLRAFAFLAGYHLAAAGKLEIRAAEALPVPMPIARAGDALSGTEQKPDAIARNPFPADNLIHSGLVSISAETQQIARHKQNSGHGEV